MKKLLTLAIIGTLLIGGLNAIALNNETEDTKTEFITNDSLNISHLSFDIKDNFAHISLPEQTSYMMEEGKPILPIISKTYTYPIGTSIDEIIVNIDRTQKTLQYKVAPAPAPVALLPELMKNYEEPSADEQIYSSNELYPETSYSVQKGIGIQNGERVLFVTLHAYTQYQPLSNNLHIPEEVDIKIEYTLPSQSIVEANVYDLLIITSEKFEEDLQPLIEHKNNVGMKTIIKTVEDIYDEYDGVAEWEEVKLFIKDAIEMYGIEYVLLAGGRKGQTDEWWVPDFPSNNYDNNGMGDMDLTYSADLYFADVYKYSVSGTPYFEDWDTDDNGIYGEGPYYMFGGYDKPDFYPDVHLGRIPFRYSWEVPIVVNKIIDYETNADNSWFKKAVFVAGDTSPYERYGSDVVRGIYEGEETCDKHAGYLEEKDFEITKLYASLGIRDVYDVAPVISEGCGWVNMQMHANPATGGNHITDQEEFARFYSFLHMAEFKNEGKLPFMVNDGCHNAQFDVTMQEVFKHGFENININWFEWIPTDASSWFLLKEGGGAIGLIGNTALGYGYLNEYWNQGLGGWIMPRFAHAYAIQGKEYAGSIWTQGITDYINNFPVTNDIVDRKTIEERGLLGDPSLKLGGYGLGTLDDSDDTDENNDSPINTLGTVEAPVWEEGDSWTYALNDLDIDFSEVDGREIIAHFETGDITLTVSEVTSTMYKTTVTTENLEVFVDIDVDLSVEDKQPIKGTGQLVNTSISGEISFDKSTLGIVNMDLFIDGALNTESLLENIDFEVPPIVIKFIPEIPLSISLKSSFEEAYELIDYPLSVDKEWGFSEGEITVEGTVESKYFRLLSTVSKIARIVGIDLLPPSITKYLPVVDLVEVLEDLGMSNQIEIPEFEGMFDTSMFLVRSEEEITVESGMYTTYNVQVFLGAGNIYYSPAVRNVVKIEGNIENFIPIIDNISLELVDTTVE